MNVLDFYRCLNECVNIVLTVEQVIEGLDTAVMSMKKGEVALVTIPPEHAFSSTESKQDLAVVPPNSVVTFEIELVSIKTVPCFYLLLVYAVTRTFLYNLLDADV